MSIVENKALVRRYFEDAPYHPEVCDQIFAHHILWHSLCQSDQLDFVSDPQAEKAAFERHKTLWGGWSESMVDMIAEGDRVMVRWSFHGIHEGEFLGIPSTHRKLSFSGIYIFRVENHRIAEVWILWDQLGEWQQLGILPESRVILSQAKNATQTQH